MLLGYLTLIICLISVDGKGKGKKKNSLATKKSVNGKATVFPSKRSKQPLKPKSLTKPKSFLNLLHKEKLYNNDYLIEYKKMILSLLPEPNLFTNFNDKKFLVLPNEIKTDKSLYSKNKAKLPVCSKVKEKNWRKVKVLQLEKKNSVTLKQNSQTGAKVVEKLMDGAKHFDKELNFFKHAHHGSTKYFPSFICSAKPKNRKERYSIITDFVDGAQSHEMAAIATSDQLRFMVAQLFNSLVELHKVGFIHCDLTPANVIVSKNFNLNVIDFGMAMPIGQANGFRGSVYTRAPELQEMSPGKIDTSIDWWAFGCTVAIWYYYHFDPEMLKDKQSIYKFSPMKLGSKKKFRSGTFPSQFSVELRKFLSMFLTIDPETRTFSTVRLQDMVRNHEYFKGFDWSSAEKY
jgi:hypothetical protein